MIRKAVAAIVFQEDKFLLASRVSILLKKGELEPISEEWDLIKGGINTGESFQDAILRELEEETGSNKYEIKCHFKDKLEYGLPEKTGFSKQESNVFLIEFTGKNTDLKPDSKEIGALKFFSKEDAIKKIKYPETRAYVINHI